MSPVQEGVQDLARATRMLGVVGAWLKLRHGDGIDPAVRAEIERGAAIVLGRSSECRDDDLLTMVEMALMESGELFRHIDQPVGWRVEDHNALLAQGRASESAFDRILALAGERPALAGALQGRLLDVGTGVGGIALRAAECCPALTIEAIDIWTPALRLAEQRIAASPHRDRIDVRELDIARLDIAPRFTLAWLPTMFLPHATVVSAHERIAAASRPGAWLAAALYTIPADPFAAVMARLRTLRSGGEITDPGVLAALLEAGGYVDVEVDVRPIATFVLARLP